ncbi:MAG TPA: bifunctional 5,10-methylenetetrahydrofolate dehydrogenase/5,10-methenyltetrahydrofolate cyclohydrolase [Patescibacteria group bacterium]|nr:bifunctional 5,10-methylenetetrahydrofolate dehydrogenase/5,10-methenyltetrahydrofolate cyclohydrolase [Patescibacteria group bacterium]
MQIIDGHKISKEILSTVESEASALPFKPLFVDVLVGNDPVSRSYVKIKSKLSRDAGFEFRCMEFGEDTPLDDIQSAMSKQQEDARLCGIIVQLPTPAHVNSEALIAAIRPELDVDCLGSEQVKRFYANAESFEPPTAGAVFELFNRLPQEFKKGQIVVVGQGRLVGMPVTHMLRKAGYRVATADKSTQDLVALCSTADVLISGVGIAGLLGPEHVKPGAAIIDAGTSEDKGSIYGDLDPAAAQLASLVTPTPGGVGPVTVACLLKNVLLVAKKKTNV